MTLAGLCHNGVPTVSHHCWFITMPHPPSPPVSPAVSLLCHPHATNGVRIVPLSPLEETSFNINTHHATVWLLCCVLLFIQPTRKRSDTKSRPLLSGNRPPRHGQGGGGGGSQPPPPPQKKMCPKSASNLVPCNNFFLAELFLGVVGWVCRLGSASLPPPDLKQWPGLKKEIFH